MNKKKRAGGRTNSKTSSSEFQHGSFWVLLAIVLFLTVLTVFKSIEQSNLTGHATIQTISFMKGGQELNFEVNDIPGVAQITIQLNEDVKDSKIIFKEDNLIEFTGDYYSKFLISSVDKEKYGNLKFFLKIKETDLLEKGISIYDLHLYVNGQELPATLLQDLPDSLANAAAGYLYYEAISPEMGTFVIGRATPLVTTSEITTTTGITEESSQVTPAAEEEPTGVGAPLVGKAGEQTLPAEGNLWTKIVSFFKNLFN
ncbi:MAG: hypothetical protein AABW48_02685 [Nanoarchaeota archaeon]